MSKSSSIYPLDQEYPIWDEHVASYNQNGFIKLGNVLDAVTIDRYDRLITEQVHVHNTQDIPLDQRDTYGRAFLQVMNLWTKHADVRRFVLNRRLAGIASRLMGVEGVRLYHDQALYKEAGGGFTPWHADQYYWPLASEKCITAWIPLQDTPLEMGALEFSRGSHRLDVARNLPISDESESLIEERLSDAHLERIAEPFRIGDVSFHAGWTFHRAAPNTTSTARRVMCIIYMDRDMLLKAPSNPNQKMDWDTWCPGAHVGEIINTPLNPVLF